MIGTSEDEEAWPSAEHEADLDDIEDRIILAAETLDSAGEVYFPDDDFVLAYFSDDAIDDEFHHAADEELRVVGASEIWAGHGLDEKELAQLTGKPY